MNDPHLFPSVNADNDIEHEMLRVPIDVQSVSAAVIALIATLYALQWAKTVLIPICFGVMLSYALAPIVHGLARWRVPRPLSAAVLLASIAAGLAGSVWSLGDEVNALVDSLPQVAAKVRDSLDKRHTSPNTFDRVQEMAAKMEAMAIADREAADAARAAAAASTAAAASASASVFTSASGATVGSPLPGAASTASSAARTAPPARPVQNGGAVPINRGPPTDRPLPDLRGFLLSGTLGAASFLGEVGVVFLVALFLLSSGNSFRRKMVKMAGPRLRRQKVTVETMDEIAHQIQRYLLVQLVVSLVVGFATWLAFFAIGMHQSAVWGVVAGLTNLVPYVGAILVGGASAVVALLQFDSPQMALVVGSSSFVIHTVVGNMLAPWFMGRASRMSAFAVFVAVLLFGWLWGVSGLLLGVPILTVVKSICDRVEDLKPVGELLGA